MTRLLFVDTETSGLDPTRHAILTLAAVVWDDGRVTDRIEWRAYGDPMQVDPSALEVNGIDLEAHNAAAEPQHVVARAFVRFCEDAFPYASLRGRIRLAGHNVAFDLGFLRQLLGPSFSRMFSVRPVCTMSMLPLFFHAGRIPKDVGKLDEALAAFGVEREGTAHTALSDALASAALYTAMLARVREGVGV